MQLATGWTIQPDFQYIWQPGGNVPDRMGSAVGECGRGRGADCHQFLTKSGV